MKKKKLLYYFWGHLSDKINISSADGCSSYLWSIFQEFMNRGWEVYCVYDRDRESVEKYGKEAFKSFSQNKRWNVYKKIKWINVGNKFTDDIFNYPKIDLLIIEWRFSTHYNQLHNNNPMYSPDLLYQNMMLNHYIYESQGNKQKSPKVILFDLDYEINEEDIDEIKPYKIIETAVKPKKGRVSVDIPFDFTEMTQFITMPVDDEKHLVYIGNDYNRREDIERKIIPYSKKYPYKVIFVGNWMTDDRKKLREKWSNITFKNRIGFNRFRDNLKDAVACPLLFPDEYKKNGFMTMRILEVLLFGSIPIGFSDFNGIEKYLSKSLIAKDYKELEDIIKWLINMEPKTRNKLRLNLINKLKFMDAKYFVDTILKEKEMK